MSSEYSVKTKQNKAFDVLKDKFGYKNVMQTPRVTKVVVSVGTGKRARLDGKWNTFVADRLFRITNQKASYRPAKFSEAGFKIRKGDIIGQMVTMRGKKAQDFLDKLIHIALPRTKDFRGIKTSAVDDGGNLNIGVKEHTIFPAVSDEEISNVFGMNITITTTCRSKEEAIEYLKYLGIPFAGEDGTIMR